MRRLVLIAILAIAGCAAPGTMPAPEPTAPASAAPKLKPTKDHKIDIRTGDKALDYFVATVQKRMPKAGRLELEAVAEQSCALLASGTDAMTVAAVARTLGTSNPRATTPTTARRLVRLSIATVCPDQRARAAEFSALDRAGRQPRDIEPL
jgi:Arc/MetJ family transcription regulator